jgi:hypothetical protein
VKVVNDPLLRLLHLGVKAGDVQRVERVHEGRRHACDTAQALGGSGMSNAQGAATLNVPKKLELEDLLIGCKLS